MPRREAVVDVTLTDGQSYSERVGTVKGTAENPMTRDEIIAKASDLVTPVLGADRCRRLVDAVFALDSRKSVRSLRPLLQRS